MGVTSAWVGTDGGAAVARDAAEAGAAQVPRQPPGGALQRAARAGHRVLLLPVTRIRDACSGLPGAARLPEDRGRWPSRRAHPPHHAQVPGRQLQRPAVRRHPPRGAHTAAVKFVPCA